MAGGIDAKQRGAATRINHAHHLQGMAADIAVGRALQGEAALQRLPDDAKAEILRPEPVGLGLGHDTFFVPGGGAVVANLKQYGTVHPGRNAQLAVGGVGDAAVGIHGPPHPVIFNMPHRAWLRWAVEIGAAFQNQGGWAEPGIAAGHLHGAFDDGARRFLGSGRATRRHDQDQGQHAGAHHHFPFNFDYGFVRTNWQYCRHAHPACPARRASVRHLDQRG